MRDLVLVGHEKRHQVIVVFLYKVEISLFESYFDQNWVRGSFSFGSCVFCVDVKSLLVELELCRQSFD